MGMNHVVHAKEHRCFCTHCDGQGFIEADKDVFFVYLENQFRLPMKLGLDVFDEIEEVIDKWIDERVIPCKYCDSKGVWIERIYGLRGDNYGKS